MKQNIKTAKELVKLAKSLISNAEETILTEILSLEKQLAEYPDMQTQEKYNSLLQQVKDLIKPPSDDEEENDEDRSYVLKKQ